MDVRINTNQVVNGVQRNHNIALVGNQNSGLPGSGNAIENAALALAEHMQANAPVAVGRAVELQNLRQEKFCQVMRLLMHKAFNTVDDKLVFLNEFDVVLVSYSEVAAFNRAINLLSIDLLPMPKKLTADIRIVAQNHPIPQNQIARQLLSRLVDYLIEPVSRRIAQGLDVDSQDLKKNSEHGTCVVDCVEYRKLR